MLIKIAEFLNKQFYNYTPETNHVSRLHAVAAVLYLQFVLQVMLLCRWNMFCTFMLVLSEVCLQCPLVPTSSCLGGFFDRVLKLTTHFRRMPGLRMHSAGICIHSDIRLPGVLLMSRHQHALPRMLILLLLLLLGWLHGHSSSFVFTNTYTFLIQWPLVYFHTHAMLFHKKFHLFRFL